MESIGKQIGKLRQEAGVTQEKLGQALGVTTQAVSRWECGGTPDASLLPAIADFFHVSIDELFGREGRKEGDTLETLIVRDLAAQPSENLFERAFELCRNIRDGMQMKYMDSCIVQDLPKFGEEYGGLELYSALLYNNGAVWMKLMRDDKLFFLIPEPENGFGSILNKPEEYEKLFALLGEPGCMKILMYLYENNDRKSPGVSAQWVAQGTDLPEEQVKDLLHKLAQAELLAERKMCVSRETEMDFYSLKSPAGATVLLMLLTARHCIHQPRAFAPLWEEREKPILTSKKWEPEEDSARETSYNVGPLRR